MTRPAALKLALAAFLAVLLLAGPALARQPPPVRDDPPPTATPLPQAPAPATPAPAPGKGQAPPTSTPAAAAPSQAPAAVPPPQPVKPYVLGTVVDAAGNLPRKELVPLSEMGAGTGALDFGPGLLERGFGFGLSPRADVTNAQLILAGRSTLRTDRPAILMVTLDGYPLAKVALPAGGGSFRTSVPLWALEPGFRRLSFRLAADNALNLCDPMDPSGALLNLDAEASGVEFTLRDRPLIPTLSNLPDIVGSPVGGSRHLRLLLTGPLSDPVIRARAMLAAQSFGLALTFRPGSVTVDRAKPAPVEVRDAAIARGAVLPLLDPTSIARDDVLLMGLQADLAPLIGRERAALIDGAYLAVFPSDVDPRRLVIVAGGRTEAELAQAILRISRRDPALPGVSAVLLDPADKAAPVVETQIPKIASGGLYSLGDLGFVTEDAGLSRRWLGEVQLPNGWTGRSTARVAFNLDFAHGPTFGRGALNLYVNGIFQGSIAFSGKGRDMVRDGRVAALLSAFRPGRNFIVIETTRDDPPAPGLCRAADAQPPDVELFSGSQVRFPVLEPGRAVPDLDRLQRADLSEADGAPQFVIPSPDQALAGAALTLAARMAQTKARLMPTLSLNISQELPLVDGVFFATPKDLPQPLMTMLAGNLATHTGTAPVWLGDLPPQPLSDRAKPRPPVVRLDAGLTDSAIATAVAAEAGPDRFGAIFVGRTGESLGIALESLAKPKYWNSFQGIIAAWAPGQEIWARRAPVPREGPPIER